MAIRCQISTKNNYTVKNDFLFTFLCVKLCQFRHWHKVIAILRRQFCIILTASWKKVYSVLDGAQYREYIFFQRRQYNAELLSQNRN